MLSIASVHEGWLCTGLSHIPSSEPWPPSSPGSGAHKVGRSSFKDLILVSHILVHVCVCLVPVHPTYEVTQPTEQMGPVGFLGL